MLVRVAQRLARTATLGACAGAICLLAAGRGEAAVFTGETFQTTFTDLTGSLAGETIVFGETLGGPAGGGLWDVTSFKYVTSSAPCPLCLFVTTDVTALRFDSADLDLSGDVTGSFLGTGGHTHTFVLTVTDPAQTWTFVETKVSTGEKTTSTGTYSTAVIQVPEPSTWAMMILGLAFAGLVGRSGRRAAAA
jgi:hypothetical protein